MGPVFARRVLLVALLLTMSGSAFGGLGDHPAGATLAAPRPPRPPRQPASGPGGADLLFDGVDVVRAGRPPDGYWLFAPKLLEMDSSPPTSASLPVVIFLHGFTALDPTAYRAWIDHIVRRGALVVYPDYQRANPFGDDWRTFLPNTFAAVRAAVTGLEEGDGPRPDLTRGAVVGHSLGGVLAAGYAASAEPEGLPIPTVLMPVAPGGCAGCGGLLDDTGVALPDLTRIRATTVAAVVVGDDDATVGESGAKRIWADLTSIPLNQRDYVTLRSDPHGVPPLRADHLLAQTARFGGSVDPLDWYGTWKLFDLLADCAFRWVGCDRALGNSEAQRYMGTWSDGVPVREAHVTDQPGPPG